MKKSLLICILFLISAATIQAQTSKAKPVKKQSPQSRTSGIKKSSVASRKTTTHRKITKKTVSKKSKTSAAKSKYRKKTRPARNMTASFASVRAEQARKKTIILSEQEQLLANGFAKSRGKLLWPVDGIVTIPFGDYTIEETTIRGRNPGITISTSNIDMPVKAVFDGVVTDVDTRGEVATIFIRHGKYYTVYSNVSAIHVTKGAEVKTGDVIGNVGEAYAATGGELTFLLMVDDSNVNPSQWLSRN